MKGNRRSVHADAAPGRAVDVSAPKCRRCGHSYSWRGGISFGAICDLGRLVRTHYAKAHPDVEVGR